MSGAPITARNCTGTFAESMPCSVVVLTSGNVSRRWSPIERPVLEVGLHLEDPDPTVNERCVAGLRSARATWAGLLPDAGIGPALGPRGGAWRRVSEFLECTDPDDPELASEAAERLALYVRTLWPLLRRQVLPPFGGDADPEIRSGA